MRRTLAASVLLLFAAAPLRAADEPKGDKELNGDWEAVSALRAGGAPAAADLAKAVFSFHDATLTVAYKGESHKGAVAVDRGKTPRTIDVTPEDGPDKGKKTLGIYEFRDDQLRLCLAEPGKDRPTEFKSEAGSGFTLLTLTRVKK